MTSIFENNLIDVIESVHCWLFPHDSLGNAITSHEELEILCSKFMAHIQPFTMNYIWHNEPFSLNVKLHAYDEQFGHLGPHLSGIIVVGDYLEDEWFILFLLVNLTKSFPNLICRIVDSDGEFPLIEAALHLPRWADPETADQRVYFKEGLLHLIPLSLFPLSSGPPPIMDAVSAVSSKPSDTLANPAVQNAIKLRIEEYPRKISKEHHTTHAYVPVAVAALLNEYPTLVSAAVRTFCNRDTKDNKCLRVMRHFPPETRVMTSVRFSKALYAQLAAHPYSPDPCTGWNISSKENNAHVIGMKLACAFEIMVCNAGGLTPATTPEEPSLDVNNPQWIKYKQTLTTNGYFRGEMEGSKLFRDLEANAQRFFLSNNLMNRSKDMAENLSMGSIVVKLLGKVNADFETFKKREKELLPPDDEKWLEVTPDTLEELLEAKFKKDGEEPPKTASEQDIANALNAFLKHTSSYEGAEIPPELMQGLDRKSSSASNCTKETVGSRKTSCSGRKQSGLLSLHPQHRKISSYSNASDASDMSSLSAKIDFHADSFSDALQNVLEFSLPEDEYFNSGDEDSSGMSSYEEDEKDISLSRKTSGESTTSKASSGVGEDLKHEAPPAIPPRKKKSSKGLKKKIPLAHLEDEFDIEDDSNDPVRIDMKVVSELLQSYSEEGRMGPTSALLASLNLNPASTL